MSGEQTSSPRSRGHSGDGCDSSGTRAHLTAPRCVARVPCVPASNRLDAHVLSVRRDMVESVMPG